MLSTSQDCPALTSFFYYGTDLIGFKFSLVVSLYSTEGVAVHIEHLEPVVVVCESLSHLLRLQCNNRHIDRLPTLFRPLFCMLRELSRLIRPKARA